MKKSPVTFFFGFIFGALMVCQLLAKPKWVYLGLDIMVFSYALTFFLPIRDERILIYKSKIKFETFLGKTLMILVVALSIIGMNFYFSHP